MIEKQERIKKVNNVEYLLISSTIDYSTDLIAYELEQRNQSYLRINRDKFAEYKVLYSLESNSLSVEIHGQIYMITDALKAVYFRAPVFLRNNKNYSLEDQLYRSQWSSFIRNLIVFENAKWINHPVATYKAENKLYQLKCAKQMGLMVPHTHVGNVLPSVSEKNMYVVKSLDAALFYEGNQEMFTYSIPLDGKELLDAEIQNAPIILQDCLQDKIDIRATVIDSQIYAVKIVVENNGIDGDWRRTDKDLLSYVPIQLPISICDKLLQLMKHLGLTFGGIDLVLADNIYYFIEVNPTGEWGWLVTSAHLPIDKSIVNALMHEGDFYK